MSSYGDSRPLAVLSLSTITSLTIRDLDWCHSSIDSWVSAFPPHLVELHIHFKDMRPQADNLPCSAALVAYMETCPLERLHIGGRDLFSVPNLITTLISRLPPSLGILRVDKWTGQDSGDAHPTAAVRASHLAEALLDLESCRVWIATLRSNLVVEYYWNPRRPTITMSDLHETLDRYAQDGLSLRFGVQEWKRPVWRGDEDDQRLSCDSRAGSRKLTFAFELAMSPSGAILSRACSHTKLQALTFGGIARPSPCLKPDRIISSPTARKRASQPMSRRVQSCFTARVPRRAGGSQQVRARRDPTFARAKSRNNLYCRDLVVGHLYHNEALLHRSHRLDRCSRLPM